MKKIELDILIGYLILILVAVTTSTLGIFLVKKFEVKNPPQLPPPSFVIVTSTPKISLYPDFDSLKSIKKLDIVNNFDSWTPETKLNNDKIFQTIVVDKGKLSKGYLYIRASLDNKALTKWESIYLKMNWTGGHIFRPDSLPIPPSDKTELLFALNEIPYLSSMPYSEQRVPKTTNWFGLFQNKREISITSFISSLRPAKIEEISLYYQCADDDLCSIYKK